MGDSEQLISDSDRERTVSSLRDHLVAGRLTLEEFSQRVEAVYNARVNRELALAQQNLPAVVQEAPARARGAGLTAAIFGRVARRGRLTLQHRSAAASLFSDLDLDLREAQLASTQSTLTLLLAFGNVDVYVPEGINTSVSGLGLFSRRRDWGRDTAREASPALRIRALSLFGTVDVWRVPADMQGDYSEIFQQLQGSQRRQLQR